MIFSSVFFIFVFLPVVLLAYFLVPKKFKNVVILLRMGRADLYCSDGFQYSFQLSFGIGDRRL